VTEFLEVLREGGRSWRLSNVWPAMVTANSSCSNRCVCASERSAIDTRPRSPNSALMRPLVSAVGTAARGSRPDSRQAAEKATSSKRRMTPP
jgi:hypothetical protein